MKNTYAVYAVYHDGNPIALGQKLSAEDAIDMYRDFAYRNIPYVGIIDEDDEEKGWFDDDMLEDELAQNIP